MILVTRLLLLGLPSSLVKREGKFKIGRHKIKTFLQNEDAYSLQKKVKRRGFKRRRVIVQGIDYQWEADLADVQNLSKDNEGIKFLLVIDVFSRFLWVRPLQDKKAKTGDRRIHRRLKRRQTAQGRQN